MTVNGLATLLALIAEEYDMDFSEARRDVWQAVMADCSDEHGMWGLTCYLRGARSSFKPHPGDILAAATATPRPQPDRPALDLPQLSDEQRIANVARLGEMVRGVFIAWKTKRTNTGGVEHGSR